MAPGGFLEVRQHCRNRLFTFDSQRTQWRACDDPPHQCFTGLAKRIHDLLIAYLATTEHFSGIAQQMQGIEDVGNHPANTSPLFMCRHHGMG